MSAIKQWRVMGLLVLISCSLAGCIVPRIHQTDKFDGSQGVQTLAIDAKQRVVIFGRRASGNTSVTVSCAEPSPDAMSALATSVGAGFESVKVAANLALAQAESAASIGLRTQSIQLLRDGMYRLCEGYSAGAIDGHEFNRQQRRYQNLMLSLLAIEQLTGAVAARPVGLGEGSAAASVGDKADEAAGNLAQAKTDLTSAQAALKKAQDTQSGHEKDCKDDPSSASCGKSAEDKAAVDGAQTALSKATETQKNAEVALLAARAAIRTQSGGAAVHFSDASGTGHLTDSSARYVAEATRTIVSTTLIASFAQEECANVWEFINGLPPAAQLSLYESLSKSVPDKSAQTASTQADDSEFVHLAKNCQHNQDLLLEHAALFTPQYETKQADSLQVLGGQGGISLSPSDGPLHFFVAGGAKPYYVSDLAPSLKGELQASIEPTVNNDNYEVLIQRPKGASKADKTSIFVVDSKRAYVEIPVTLTKVSAPAK